MVTSQTWEKNQQKPNKKNHLKGNLKTFTTTISLHNPYIGQLTTTYYNVHDRGVPYFIFPYKTIKLKFIHYYSHIFCDVALYGSIPRGNYIKLKQVCAMCLKNKKT
jgi:hypothetical protein